jgi:hypothetical protein
MVNEKSYIMIDAFMVNELHIKGNELLIFAIIYGFSQDGNSEFTGSLQYLADWTCSTKQGVIKALKSLCEKQLIIKNTIIQNGKKYCSYKCNMSAIYEDGQLSLIDGSTKFNESGKLSLPNNINNMLDNTNNNTTSSPSEEKPKKHKVGTYKNVLLADDEQQKLCEKLGAEKAKAVVDNYSELKEMKGYKYNSDYLAILKWGIRAYEEELQKQQKKQNPQYKNFDKQAVVEKDFFSQQ